MQTNASFSALIAAPLVALSACAVYAQEWTVNVAPSLTSGSYQDSALRQSYSESGATLALNYRDQSGVAFGLGRTTIGMKNGVPDTQQYNQFASGHWNYQISSLPGRWTARMDVHAIQNNDQSGVTDRVAVWAPQISWLSTDGALYADVGLARSRYQNDFTVTQITPTLGFAMNERYDWLQLRGYLINGMNPLLTAGKTETSALEAKWTHYLKPGSSAYRPVSYSVGIMGGERMYAVDMDAQSVANLSDVHTGSANVGVTWQLDQNFKLFVLLGQSRFHSTTADTDYRLNVANATVSLNF